MFDDGNKGGGGGVVLEDRGVGLEWSVGDGGNRCIMRYHGYCCMDASAQARLVLLECFTE